ncbi:MAG: hypothetical protein PHT44_01540 [Candidatus Portnoybacteria bacterium]|nr:hypothetical protein [Candidatus Portnoybacteria bacterium]MDD4982722.1 hypothetical protein [Candidatus Portnoybacteria bacterium]
MKKTHAIIFLAVFLCLLIGGKVFAADYKIEVPLPGLPSGSSISDPGQYVKYLFIFGLALAGFLAVAAIAYGGIKYMLSGTTITNVQDAKDLIYGALIGIGFLLGSYLLLYTIDPTLTNLSLVSLNKINIPKIIEDYDLPANITAGKTADELNAIISSGKINGQATASCSIGTCGSQTVQGHTLSSGAAAKYSDLRQNIQQACAEQGLSCDTSISSSVDGQHASSCHKQGTATSGTCGDFVITAPECGGSIKSCSPAVKEKYIQVASGVLSGSGAKDIRTCLNEYKVKGSSYSTGGHFHCNF